MAKLLTDWLTDWLTDYKVSSSVAEKSQLQHNVS